MSAGLLGALAGVGPGRTIARETKIAEADSQIRREEADRAQEMHEWKVDFGALMQARNDVDDLTATVMPNVAAYLHGGPSAVTQFDPVGRAPSATTMPLPDRPPQQPMIPINVPGFQEGGPAQIPATPAPVIQEAVAETVVGAPTAPQGQPRPNRRARYDDWHGQASRYAFLTGGMEGISKFQEMEDATSRQQIMGYGLQAVRAMDEGNVGEAMRAGNSALEVTPFDTGLQFVARDGKLHIQGEDGSVGNSLSTQHLMAFVEDHMKTPEQYLQWKQQYETERAALVDEGVRDRLASVTEAQQTLREEIDPRMTAVAEGALPSQNLARNAQAYAAIRGSDAEVARAQAALNNDAAGLGWDENNLLAINRDFTDAYNAGELFLSPEVQSSFEADPLASNLIVGAGIDIVKSNPPETANFQDAAAIAQLAFAGLFGVDMGQAATLDTAVQGDQHYVRYNGTAYRIPQHVYDMIQQQKGDTAEDTEE